MNTMNEQQLLFNLCRVYRSHGSFYTNPFKHLERLNIVRSIDTLAILVSYCHTVAANSIGWVLQSSLELYYGFGLS